MCQALKDSCPYQDVGVGGAVAVCGMGRSHPLPKDPARLGEMEARGGGGGDCGEKGPGLSL